MDPIAEMFSRIVNAKNSDNNKLIVPFSKIKMAILNILKNNGKISDFKEFQDNKFKKIEVSIWRSKINAISRISRPGKRAYATNGQIPIPKTPHGLIIISTPQGIMNGEEARKKGLGGEVICEVF